MTVKVDVTTGTIEHKFGTRVHSMHMPADKGLQILGYLARARQTRRTAEEILQAVWPPNTVFPAGNGVRDRGRLASEKLSARAIRSKISFMASEGGAREFSTQTRRVRKALSENSKLCLGTCCQCS